MPKIYIRAKPGRVARISPRGAMIPEDRFIPVDLSPYIRRLLYVHGDIEARDGSAPAKKKPAAPKIALPADAPVGYTEPPKE